MQDLEHGVPVRSQKLFLTSIPAAFMGEPVCYLPQSSVRRRTVGVSEFLNIQPESLRIAETETDELCLQVPSVSVSVLG